MTELPDTSVAAIDPLQPLKQFTMAHPKLQAMHEEVRQAIREPGGASLLFLLGPTGVGKTTLVARLMQQLTLEQMPELAQMRVRLAVAGLEAEAPPHGNYDFKQHFKRSLLALQEILIEYRLDMSGQALAARERGSVILNAKTNVAALRSALEDALKRRRPTAFFIDEAHHLGKVAGGRKLQDHLDVIKSLANLTDTLHVLVGTYELQNLLHLSDQLSRRSRTFHFARYRAGLTADVQAFDNILWNFQQRLPFTKPLELRTQSAYLLERSLGCVGVLKGWLVRAAARALQQDTTTLTLAQLRQTEPTDSEWRSMAATLLAGEEAWRESEAELDKLRWRLRQEPSSVPGAPAASTSPPEQAATAPRGQRRPGERRPQRDRIRQGAEGDLP